MCSPAEHCSIRPMGASKHTVHLRCSGTSSSTSARVRTRPRDDRSRATVLALLMVGVGVGTFSGMSLQGWMGTAVQYYARIPWGVRADTARSAHSLILHISSGTALQHGGRRSFAPQGRLRVLSLHATHQRAVVRTARPPSLSVRGVLHRHGSGARGHRRCASSAGLRRMHPGSQGRPNHRRSEGCQSNCARRSRIG